MTFFEVIASIPNGLGVGAVMFAGLFWLMASGRLITAREHDARVGDLKEQNQILRETSDLQAQNFNVLIENDRVHIENAQTSLETLDSIKRLAEQNQASRRGDV